MRLVSLRREYRVPLERHQYIRLLFLAKSSSMTQGRRVSSCLPGFDSGEAMLMRGVSPLVGSTSC